MMRAVQLLAGERRPVTTSRRARAARRFPLERLRSLALGVALPLAILAAWTIAVQLHVMRPQILPSPPAVWRAGRDLLSSGDLVAALAISLERVVVGLLIGGSLGVVFGVAMGRSRVIDAYVGPTIRTLCQIPTIAWLPFFMLVFGIGEELKLAVIAKASLLPVLLNSYAAMRAAPRRYLEVADVLELTAWQRLRLISLPAALPLFVAGARLGLSNAWHVLIVVEMIASAAGIGHLMAWSRTLFQLDVVFVTIVSIGIVGGVMDASMRLLERRLAPWAVST